MRALLLHVNKFEVNVIEESRRPFGIVPETKKGTSEKMEQCLVAFFCIEKTDTEKQLDELFREIIKTAKEFSTENLMISPFVHLSKNISDPKTAKKYYLELLKRFKATEFNIQSSYFGYHKRLLLDIKGHPGSFRYREFY
ncbi:MAG: threonyl-tRNA synthetase editing domain-containing protein [Patescibacteria group bacterium]